MQRSTGRFIEVAAVKHTCVLWVGPTWHFGSSAQARAPKNYDYTNVYGSSTKIFYKWHTGHKIFTVPKQTAPNRGNEREGDRRFTSIWNCGYFLNTLILSFQTGDGEIVILK
jgi:hypothetical protein